MTKKSEIMVSVCVCTYNQEKWIRQTLDSILAQKTEYPFEVIIGEDHGSDGTRALCQEYAEKYENVTLLPSPENLGVTANWIQCIQAGKGKYIMSCAGDDWWHNPNKIQLQVDFMEAHPECVLCHTDEDEYYENTGITKKAIKQSNGIVPPEGKIQKTILSGEEHISAVTMCIRRSTFEEHVPADEFAKRRFPREDWPVLLVLAAYGDIRYIPVSTATYRIGQESITRTSNYEKVIRRAQEDMEMTKYLYSLFPEWGPFRDEPYFATVGYHNALHAAYRNNDYAAAHEFAKKAFPNKWVSRMARTKLTFHLFRWIQLKRRKL